ncbi:MAG: hypothetical protein V3T77_01810 [Planctomycetota bacterium]
MNSFHKIFLALALLLAIPGCHATPATLRVVLHPEEKDVLLYRVELSRPLRPVEYLRWSEEDLERIGHDPVNPFYPATPVYQLQYAFFHGPHHLASVFYERDDESQSDEFQRIGNLRYLRTVVNTYKERESGQDGGP